MAWTEKLPSGKFRGCYRDSAGKKCHAGTFGRKSDARAAAQEAEVKARRVAAATEGQVSARTPWGEWSDATLPERPHSDTDVVEEAIIRRHLKPTWATTPLNRITRAATQSWVNRLSAEYSPAYVRRIYGLFQTSLNRAVERDVLTGSPCVGVKLPRIPKKDKPYMTVEYVKRLESPGKDGRPILRSMTHRRMLEFGLETGLRPGESCGLHANRADLDSGWLTVSEVMVSRKHLIRPWPKDHDTRYVPLTNRAIGIIREALAGRDLTRGCGLEHSDGARCASVLVFLNDRGDPVLPRSLYIAVYEAAKREGLPVLSPYAARRGFGTRAADGGLNAFALQDAMGHSTMDETAEYVQRTDAARKALQLALGERPDLDIVGGARGAVRGADLAKQAGQSWAPDETRDHA